MAVQRDPAYLRAQRLCTISLLCSVIIMLGGLVWAYVIGMQVVRVEHPLSHVQDDLATLRSAVRQAEAKAR